MSNDDAKVAVTSRFAETALRTIHLEGSGEGAISPIALDQIPIGSEQLRVCQVLD